MSWATNCERRAAALRVLFAASVYFAHLRQHGVCRHGCCCSHRLGLRHRIICYDTRTSLAHGGEGQVRRCGGGLKFGREGRDGLALQMSGLSVSQMAGAAPFKSRILWLLSDFLRSLPCSTIAIRRRRRPDIAVAAKGEPNPSEPVSSPATAVEGRGAGIAQHLEPRFGNYFRGRRWRCPRG